MKNNYDENGILIENPTFQEEIPSNEVNEVVYENKKKKRLLLILIILFLALALLFGLGYYYMKKGSSGGGNNVKGDLLVVHSKTGFGDSIPNLNVYTTYQNSYTYTFYVENQNDFSLSYDIFLEDLDDDSLGSKLDKKKINYIIKKNDEVLFSGKLESGKKDLLASVKIAAGFVDNYKIYLWTDSSNSGYYSFRVNVSK